MFSNPDIATMGFDGCVNLQCRQVTCKSGKNTRLKGRVNIPAGNLPIPGAYVYVPNSELKPLVTGPSCERCDQQFSGEPIARTQTDTNGVFTLESVPIGENVPLVVQVGKWRRQISISTVEACTDTSVPEELTRLPRNKAEGNIPKIALSTGSKDVLECLIRKIGVEDSEITPETGAGRVNLYARPGGTSSYAPTMNGGVAFTSSQTLWNSAANLYNYDLFIGSCEGGQQPSNESPQAIQNMYDFVNFGGRVFASHWHNYWILKQPAWTPGGAGNLITYNLQPDLLDVTADINTSFTRGARFADWLILPTVNGSGVRGKIDLKAAQNTLEAVDTTRVQSWITVPASKNVQYASFDTPITVPASQKCGRFVLSDIHVSSTDQPNMPFPSGCTSGALSAQEKALVFLLFDLSSCIEPPIG